MLTGDQVLAARTRAGLTQQQLADLIGVTLRSVGNWERSEQVPRQAEARLRERFGSYLRADDAAPSTDLSSVSDALLLAEIARRFERGREDVRDDGRSAPTPRAGGSPATVTPIRSGPSPEALDPTLPDDVVLAARDEDAPMSADQERRRQDDDAEGPR